MLTTEPEPNKILSNYKINKNQFDRCKIITNITMNLKWYYDQIFAPLNFWVYHINSVEE